MNLQGVSDDAMKPLKSAHLQFKVGLLGIFWSQVHTREDKKQKKKGQDPFIRLKRSRHYQSSREVELMNF